MSILKDLSLMDILFDKEDQIKFEKELSLEEPSEDKQLISNEYWGNTGDDVLDSILFNQNLDFLPDSEFLSKDPLDVTSSVYSDSGVSEEQQLSPVSHESGSDEGIGGGIKQEAVEIDPSMLSLLGEEIDMDQVTLHPHSPRLHEDDDVEEEQTQRQTKVGVSKPVVRVKPSLGKQASSSPKVIHVTPCASRSRSILIPVSIKGRSGVRAVRIVGSLGKAPQARGRRAKAERASPAHHDDPARSSSDDESHDASDSLYPRLRLTDEEKKLMMKEGVSLPTHYPLTKEEERELKRIRRKIRNKISAQDSRKRKKEYVDGLEDRVKQCSVENANLMKRVKALQCENQSLSVQLRRLQAVIAKSQTGGGGGGGAQAGGGAGGAQPGTTLMVIVLSLALLMAPSLRGARTANQSDLGAPARGLTDGKTPTSGRSRSLLEMSGGAVESGGFVEPPLDDMEEDSKAEAELLQDLGGLLQFRKGAPPPSHHDHDYTNALLGRKRGRSFVVPPIEDDDDDWPPRPPKAQPAALANRGGGAFPMGARRNRTAEPSFKVTTRFIGEHKVL